MMGERRTGFLLSPLDPLFFRDGRPFDAATRTVTGLPQPQTFAGAIRTAFLQQLSVKNFRDFMDMRGVRGVDRQHATEREVVREQLKACKFPAELADLVYRGPWPVLVLDNEAGVLCSSSRQSQNVSARTREIIPLLPTPSTLLRESPSPASPGCDNRGATWYWLSPLNDGIPGWQPPGEAPQLKPLWLTARTEAESPGGYLTLEGIKRFLNPTSCAKQSKGDANVGSQAESFDDEWFTQDDIFGYESRTGIEINADTLTVEKSMLYGIRFLSLNHRVRRQHVVDDEVNKDRYRNARVAFYGEAVIPDAASQLTLPQLDIPFSFGGEGKLVHLQTVEPVSWPGEIAEPAASGSIPSRVSTSANGASKKSMLLMATPGLFADDTKKSSWMPDAFRSQSNALIGASSSASVGVSGWDVARGGPKPTRFAVPAGAVYFVEGNMPLPNQSLCSSIDAVAEGWGFALQGVWK